MEGGGAGDFDPQPKKENIIAIPTYACGVCVVVLVVSSFCSAAFRAGFPQAFLFCFSLFSELRGSSDIPVASWTVEAAQCTQDSRSKIRCLFSARRFQAKTHIRWNNKQIAASCSISPSEMRRKSCD